MSVLWSADDVTWLGVDPRCSDCGQALTYPAFFWHGHDTIVLDADCALHVMCVIGYDLREIRKGSNGQYEPRRPMFLTDAQRRLVELTEIRDSLEP